MLQLSLSREQVTSIIKVVQTLIGGEPFTLKDSNNLETLWEGASDTLAPVCFVT
jgi:hypothetical protein